MDRLKERLDTLRPLSADHVGRLWSLWDKEDALHVYATNAIEGSTLDLGETLAVLEDGITIGGKKVGEIFDVVHGQKAYMLMLKFAKDQIPVTTAILRGLHRAVVGGDYAKISACIDEMIANYETSRETEHPIATAAKLHFDLVHIHPFTDGNGRTARLLGNLELIRNGFVPILIEKEDRNAYFNVLERCHMGGEPGKGDPTEFVAFVEEFERKALERYLRVLEISENIPFDQSSRQVGLRREVLGDRAE